MRYINLRLTYLLTYLPVKAPIGYSVNTFTPKNSVPYAANHSSTQDEGHGT